MATETDDEDQILKSPTRRASKLVGPSRLFSWVRTPVVARPMEFVGTLLLISAVTFVAIRLVGGDIALQALGREASPEQLEAFRAANGLNDPIVIQYVHWLWDFIRGDWGVDPVSGRPILSTIVSPFAHTLVLALAALAIAVPLSMGLGLWAAARYSNFADRALLTTSIVLVAVPEFVVAISMIVIFGVWLGWLPVDSTALLYSDSLTEKVRGIILPILTLVIALSTYFFRIARSACHEVLEAPYFESAKLRGIGTSFLVRRYVIRNAMTPLINAVAIGAVHLIGGVILVEQIFGYPGLGQALIQSVSGGSVEVVQVIVVCLAAVFLLIGAVADGTVRALNRPVMGGRG